MTRIVVVRPEPGNASTTARAHALGFDVLSCPLFGVVPVAWTAPDPGAFDAVLITSTNALRHGGAQLSQLAALPVIAVGSASAQAATDAGFSVAATGNGDAHAAVELAAHDGFARLLHLGGRDRIGIPGAVAVTVYASEPRDIPIGAAESWRDCTILLHSPRAARRVVDLIARDRVDTATIEIAALSDAVAAAAGTGWRAVRVAPQPTDDALLLVAHATTD